MHLSQKGRNNRMNKIMRKLTSAVVFAAVAVTTTSIGFAAGSSSSFTDISDAKYAWAASYIEAMAKKGLISGYDDKTYRPDNEVTKQECISLFARAMGSNDSANAGVLTIAHTEYDEIINTYGLSWGTDEIAYLMYRGAFKKSDLDTYLKDDTKKQPMQRSEAAIIITKALLGEKAANAESNITFKYTDASAITTSAKPYVYYATEQGIMKGLDDGSFSPSTSVTRAQIAVMLSRVVEKANYTFEKAKLVSINTSEKSCVEKLADGTTKTPVYSDSTIMSVLGTQTKPSAMTAGVSAVFGYSGDALMFIDTLSSKPDETVVGKFMGYGSTNGAMYVSVIPTGESTLTSYNCADDVTITYAGSAASIRAFAKDDYVSLELSDGKVESITGATQTTTVKGAVITNISIDPKLQITISHADSEYDGKTYDVADNVSVTKNGTDSSFSNIYVGDTVQLTLQYGVVKSVSATSSQKVVTGTIQSLTIATNPKMTVRVNGTDTEYMIPTDVIITVNGATGTLYDFRVGDSVSLTLESQAIVKIVATTTQESAGSVKGVVKSINASYGFITVLPEGADATTTVFCKDLKTTFITDTGTTKKMSNINEGDTVEVKGTISNGAFVATLVIITAK